ncbi:hypothetical protein [Streptomyces sp. NBC_00272]|uniref:hypothetical protein n=1 Tax=Streptomyces sp. NBC_00272 TaxID=2975698 RepID=UPI002E2AA281|nr:hypothetical protein [Streptomyces sp. NBC_00272]
MVHGITPPPVTEYLRRAGVTVQRDPIGRIYRHHPHGLAFKGEAPKGHQRPVVTAPVARAVAVLERLQPPGQDFLFAPLPSAARHQVAEQTDRVAGYYTTNKHLAAYVTWTNDYCTTRGRHDLVPDVGGRRFRLTTRQSAAGSPGSSRAAPAEPSWEPCSTAASPFTCSKATRAPATPDSDEVETEQALARRHFLADLATGEDRIALTGPAAAPTPLRVVARPAAHGRCGLLCRQPATAEPSGTARSRRRRAPSRAAGGSPGGQAGTAGETTSRGLACDAMDTLPRHGRRGRCR